MKDNCYNHVFQVTGKHRLIEDKVNEVVFDGVSTADQIHVLTQHPVDSYVEGEKVVISIKKDKIKGE